MPEGAARTSLRQALSNLQKLVGPHVSVTRQTAAFDPTSPYQLDVEVFLDLLHGSSGPLAHSTGGPMRLREAVEQYKGDFLEGFYVRDAPDFDEWAVGQRERLRQLVLQALHELAVHHSARGEYSQAADCLAQLISLDPWREDAHRQLMLVLAYSGQRDAALAQYQTCRRVLDEELGEKPAAETTALYERIRAGVVEPPSLPRTRPNNLQSPPTPLLGREEELKRVGALLESSECRLLTLVGPGGVGKTRLGLQVATDLLESFDGGAFFVDLAPVVEPDLVLTTIASALGVRETPGQPLVESVRARLRQGRVLLLLDNFEQVLSAAPLVAELLGTCPDLSVLVTSRAVLRLRGEYEFPVSPLALPDLSRLPDLETLVDSPVVALFAQRARAVQTDFRVTEENASSVATICVRLDGLPLAIELAAARIKLLRPHELLIGLNSRLRLLTGGARDLPARHRTLRAAISWSYDLLSDDERRLFHRASVFAGGCSLEALEAICEGDDGQNGFDALEGVSSLLDHSLLRRVEQPEGEARFGMLETIREYALERLEMSEEGETVHRRHAEYCLALVWISQFKDGR